MPVSSENAPPPRSRSPESPGAEQAAQSERFPRSDRLLRRSEFVRVQQQGRRVHAEHFILLLLRGRDVAATTRLGVTVGKRVGGAVQRNRAKRLVREVFRRNRELFPVGCDVVLVARPGADRLDYSSVQAELARIQSAIERVRKQLWATPTAPSQP
jgi:ribonuclease P protein component